MSVVPQWCQKWDRPPAGKQRTQQRTSRKKQVQVRTGREEHRSKDGRRLQCCISRVQLEVGRVAFDDPLAISAVSVVLGSTAASSALRLPCLLTLHQRYTNSTPTLHQRYISATSALHRVCIEQCVMDYLRMAK